MNYKDRYNQYMYSYPHKRTYEFTSRLDLSKYKKSFINKDMSLYIHIPFCKFKCGYCNLFSTTNANIDKYQQYIEAIKQHSKQMKSEINFEHTNFNSFILGGGTPLILTTSQLDELFEYCQKEYHFELKNIFSVIETSPTQTNSEKLNLLKSHHFKRLSIGIQSFKDEELRMIERGENALNSIKALELIKTYHFDVLNIDLIYGIPNQTHKSFEFSINTALQYEPEEIFLYPLYKQVNARLYNKFEINYKKQYELYELGRDILIDKGYNQLSMRNFSKKRPNHLDCGFENTLSLGCGGRSYFDNLHFCEKYVSNKTACDNELNDYIQKTDFLENISFFCLDISELKRKYAIKNLLYFTGLSQEDYNKQFSANILHDFPFIKELIENDCIYFDKTTNRFYLTKKGMGLSDMIGPMFMSEYVREKMNHYD